MKNNKETLKWLKENRVNKYGDIDLSGIDFSEMKVDFSRVKATDINNNSQKATNYIDNNSQEATNIFNYSQKATKIIYNKSQEAKYIDNKSQEATNIYNYSQKAKRIYNNSQEATNIYNDSQKAKRIYNNNQEIIKETHTIIIDGKEIELSEESYQAFKNQFKGE